jgi:DNA-binding NarL/FixJ family response regulator
MTSSPRRLNVLVVHSEPVIALGLAAALRQEADMDVHLARESAARHDRIPARLDVVVADYRGALLQATRARSPQPGSAAAPHVLAVTMHDREHEVRVALEAGVHGYLLLDCAVADLVEAVRTLARGSRYLCREVAQRMAESLTRESLTMRESEVLHLLSLGQCNKAIARELDIAVGTVKAHVKAIMNKLEAASRTEAVSIAVQRGLVAQAHEFEAPQASPTMHRAAMTPRWSVASQASFA